MFRKTLIGSTLTAAISMVLTATASINSAAFASDIIFNALYAKKIPYKQIPYKQGHKQHFGASSLNLKKFNTKVRPFARIYKHLKPRSTC
ncbi:MAG: hypothetical protein ACI9TY_001438 [Alphaproteobacteria bacterium]|jgi:hypothetical protein